MRTISRYLAMFVIIVSVAMADMTLGYGQLVSGQNAPTFSLKDLSGQIRDLSQMRDKPLIILYFFDVGSMPSQEGLLSLNQLAKQHKDSPLTVLAITLSSKEKVGEFAARSDLTFPIIQDSLNVSDRYGARLILPTVCIVGPELKVLDYYQGGGKATQAMLVRLAERELQRRQTALAKAISEEVVKKNPDDVKAKTVTGYAALQEGNVAEAEKAKEEENQF